MKRIILALALVAFAGSQVQQAHAGDREWAVAGKVLTGIAAASVVAHALAPAPAPAYYAPTYYVAPAPAPVVVTSAPVVAVPAAPVCPPAPTIVYQPAPAPVVVYQPPVYVQTVPVVSVYGAYSCRPRFLGRPYHHGRW